MRKFALLTVITLLIVVTLAGCKSVSDDKTFGKEDREITIGSGERFMIQLEENPSTGYTWSFTISDDSVLYLFANEFDENSSDNLIVGSGGMRKLTFQGKSDGTSTINFVYERSWEKDPEDEVLVYNVTVE